MIIKYLIAYMLGLAILVYGLKQLHNFQYEESYYTIGCGEALFRTTGSAAPRDSLEVSMFYDCIFNGVKKWPNYEAAKKQFKESLK